jgi:hypothetical protein
MTNNGWSAVTEAAVTRVYVAGDVNGCTFRSGDVATVFTWLFEQIDTRVEHVTMLNGWRSVAENIKDGGDPGSNHLSGTAGDVNGFKHPYEHLLPVGQRYGNYHSGWTNSQIAEIRKILAEAGLFAWGLDYGSGWRDAMHFDLRSGTRPAPPRSPRRWAVGRRWSATTPTPRSSCACGRRTPTASSGRFSTSRCW